jgi:hypothetical protein
MQFGQSQWYFLYYHAFKGVVIQIEAGGIGQVNKK